MTVSKLDVARIQMNDAVRLLRSLVSVHTLASAAGEVLNDLLEHRGLTSKLRLRLKQIVKPEYYDEFMSALRKPQNFFKHADRDPDASLEFSGFTAEAMILDATQMYRTLRERATFESLLFEIWFVMRYSEMFPDAGFKASTMDFASALSLTATDFEAFRYIIEVKPEIPASTLGKLD